MKCTRCSPSWRSRPPAGCAPGSTGRVQSSAPPRCATASRSSRSTSRSTASTGTRSIWWSRSRTASTPARGALHLRLARPGGRVRQRPRRRGRRGGARRTRARRRSRGIQACTPRGKRQAFFGGWRDMPVYALDELAARPHLDRPRHHRGRNHDRADRYRRSRHGQCAGMAGYRVALMVPDELTKITGSGESDRPMSGLRDIRDLWLSSRISLRSCGLLAARSVHYRFRPLHGQSRPCIRPRPNSFASHNGTVAS